ncbi:MAG TPA: DUF881 domain-containing protein [Propioniciclava sp.]|jgi:uncharacterized protein YlxW (UPF0749 family)|uniref:DUF881 domain-containing protein n=1 Tax=Propioniciclava sp. TaxID=2038686 RepID=UPI002C927ED0|nr:DUF881 domain-containing protein [Propioniciclava sp.]HRL48105.1 DUF881 domain-containing protein [Propioniciclava sp.]HRL79797.1 DUF881 domain-containing protein [Propioniciclava sp.]
MTAPTQSRPDSSMDLLNNLRKDALDPSYAAAAAAHGSRRRGHVLAPALLIVGLLFGTAVATTWRSAPEAAQERTAIIERITTTEQRIDELSTRAAELEQEIRERRRSAGTLTAAQQSRVDQLGPATGADPVTGPGIRITVDDGPETVSGSRVVDTDLRMAANGLWASGAEAVSINGYRLSARTAIRNAGGAITVDYRSLTRPYVLEAIGDLDTLGTAFPATDGGRWLAGLKEHYGMQSSLERVRSLSLSADPGLDVTRASAVR